MNEIAPDRERDLLRKIEELVIERERLTAENERQFKATTEDQEIIARLLAENGRLLRCIVSIEDELCREPARVGDALFVCEAARACAAYQQLSVNPGEGK
jgi:predicted nuclease with TOPRIM domain